MSPSEALGGGSAIAVLLIAVTAFYFISLLPLYGVFSKAGRPGWAAFVPIYNTLTILDIVGRPGWWLVFLFIPGVNIVVGAILYYELAKAFGRGMGFTLGLVFVNWIFLMILWLGSSTYEDPIEGVGREAAPAPGTDFLFALFFGLAILTSMLVMLVDHNVFVVVYGIFAITIFAFFLGSAIDTKSQVRKAWSIRADQDVPDPLTARRLDRRSDECTPWPGVPGRNGDHRDPHPEDPVLEGGVMHESEAGEVLTLHGQSETQPTGPGTIYGSSRSAEVGYSPTHG
jgi:hypothetical protein